MLEYLTTGVLPELVHALIAGLAAIRYLWPVWLVIAALWLLTRGMRAVGRFFGFSSPTAKPAKPAVRSRR
ncbi:MAG TPA: hypothetical protein VGP33_17340 [Chloroflexota bacterium]|nr:hypothetical protein [Chloroflexota bacterium]